MAMGTSSGILDFVQRFRTLQVQRQSDEDLIQDLLSYAGAIESKLRADNTTLMNQLRDVELDLAAATKMRRELQQQLRLAEAQSNALLQENSHIKDRNPYVVVLIDGDGLLFDQSFIKQGQEGGKAAAYALHSAILSRCGDYHSGVEVVAKVYSNLSGLAKAMRLDGSLNNERDLRAFSVGFTQGKATFDFIDVGYGKERADSKIKETTRWHLGNHNCKQVVLGISHDAGYAPFLDELFLDDANKARITVVEGVRTARELMHTGVGIIDLNGTLFRSDKLVDRFPLAMTTPLNSAGVIEAPKSSPGPIAPPTNLTPATSAESTPAAAPATTYARAIANGSPPPQVTLPTQPRTVEKPARAGPAKPSQWNPGPRGLDPPLQVSQSALDSIKKRRDGNKLCNNHYLRGPCSKGDSCCFEHKYKPNKDEINAIAFLTRLNPCEGRQECEVENCIYGHHCPSVRDGFCTHNFCKFGPEDHPPGTKLRGHGKPSR